MKKSLFIGTSLLLGSFFSFPVLADLYLSIGAGMGYPGDSSVNSEVLGIPYDFDYKTKDTGLFSVGIGKKFDDKRVEFIYSKATVELDELRFTKYGKVVTGKISPALKSDVSSYMVYGLKDFTTDSKFTPYAGIGVGFTSLSGRDQKGTFDGKPVEWLGGSETILSFGLKGGASYDLADNTALFTEATYKNIGSYNVSKAKFETANHDSNSIFKIIVGLRFSF
tara:strand:+ start:220 stop:888 length:669 start_codon:yes stop_codon:yes gene_type:complete